MVTSLLIACAPRASTETVPSDHASTPPRCGADPRATWLDPHDRACTSDAQCETLWTRTCDPLALRVGAGAAHASRMCRSLTGPDACACAIPVTEQRCSAGCCQMRIFSGVDDGRPWSP